jgi:hypothetical protein
MDVLEMDEGRHLRAHIDGRIGTAMDDLRINVPNFLQTITSDNQRGTNHRNYHILGTKQAACKRLLAYSSQALYINLQASQADGGLLAWLLATAWTV